MPRPNILFIHTDQQRWDALGANGNDEIQTPNLDRLASEGVNFDRYFVQNPVCMPSRASYLTGQYPSQLGIVRMGAPLPEDTETLPRMLDQYGYTSANLGKLHFLPHSNRDHSQRHPAYGFDELEIADEPGCYEDAYRAWVRTKAPDQLDSVSVGLPPATDEYHDLMDIDDGIDHPEPRFRREAVPFAADSDLTHSAFVADRTIDFIDRQANDEPFLGVAGFYSPHSPWVVPEEFLDRYDPGDLSLPEFPPELDARRSGDEFSDEELCSVRHGYYAMVSEVDYHVGRILDSLERQGLADNTIVVFTSDHGEMLGEHLQYGKGWPGYDSITRVPCIVRWPDGIDAPGRTVHDIVEGVDLVPTLLECAGIQVPPHLDGRSLSPVLTRNADHDGRGSALMEDHRGKSIRTDRYRYCIDRDGEDMLFDLETDPREYEDLSDEAGYADLRSELRGRLLERIIDAEETEPVTALY